MRILIIEDEFFIADVIKDRLEQEEFQVEIALDGEIGEYNALSGIYDLIILDGMLPGVDGFDIVRHLREKSIICPVIMLTARTLLEDKLEGLNNGADDYMTKPFEMEELVARVNALLRRNTGYKNDSLEFGNIRLDTSGGKLVCSNNGKSINISSKELMLMEYFLINRQQSVSKQQITERIWGYEEDVDYNNVEVYVSFLRKKLKHIGADIEINTVRGVGYCLEEKERG